MDEGPEQDAVAPAAPDDTTALPVPPDQVKLTKADRLEAKAARLREAHERAAAAAPPQVPAGARRIGGWPLVAAGVLVLALVAAVVFLAVRLGQQSSKVDDLGKQVASASAQSLARDSAVATATKYAIDFGSYDYAKLDQDFQVVSSHLTPAFASKYKQISQQLRSVIVQYKGKSTATVGGAGVESLRGKQAVVLIFLDQTVTTTQSKTPRVDRNRVKMTMQRQPRGTWLISDLVLA